MYDESKKAMKNKQIEMWNSRLTFHYIQWAIWLLRSERFNLSRLLKTFKSTQFVRHFVRQTHFLFPMLLHFMQCLMIDGALAFAFKNACARIFGGMKLCWYDETELLAFFWMGGIDGAHFKQLMAFAIILSPFWTFSKQRYYISAPRSRQGIQ